MTEPKMAFSLVEKVRKITKKALIVKLRLMLLTLPKSPVQ